MKKILNIMLSLCLMLSSFVGINIVQAEESETVNVSIYPKPQSIQIDTQWMEFNGNVDIYVHGEQDVATLPKLKAILDNENITYQEVTTLNNEHATIILATDCDNCDICNSVSDEANALSEEQGYVLTSENTTYSNGSITIVGSDADGVYYGVMSLKQMFQQKNSEGAIAKVVISDYPDVKFRGYVEGFYGIPWTQEDRALLFEDTTNYKMTTYIYAPKDDPYHRASWRTLYPSEEANNLSVLAQKATENNMEFCWTIHPGADYNYTTDNDGDGLVDDYETLIEKFEQVYSFGVRQFGIFYDDLDYAVANGTQHAQVLNDIYAYMTSKYDDVKPMITVVTRYTNAWGADWNSYFKPFMQNIHEDTLVLWTGQSTMSAITKDYMEYPKTTTGIDRDYGVWWNYPVNDYANSNMLMSPLDCLGTDVDNITTFFLNPMSEADASRVAIYSGADYAWNVSNFDSYNSWLRAIEELVPEAKDAFARFADNIGYMDQGNGFVFNESVYLQEDLERFEAATDENKLAEIQNMKAKFEQMVADAELLKTIENRRLYDEIQYHLEAYQCVAQAGAAAMSALEAISNNDMGTALAMKSLMDTKLEESTNYSIPILNGETQVAVCTHLVLPLVRTQASQIADAINDSIAVEADAEMITNTTLTSSVTYENETYSLANLNASMQTNDYVGMKLPKVMNIKNIQATLTNGTAFQLQYSLNGIVWHDASATYENQVLKSDVITPAAYVRLLCTSDSDVEITSLSIKESKKVEATGSAAPTISTDLTHYENYVLNNAIDKNLTTWFWSNSGSSDGSYLMVDLQSEMNLYNVTIYSGINRLGVVDGFASTQLEVSSNGSEWTSVGSPLTIDAYQDVDDTMKKLVFSLDGVSARYFRLRAIGASDSWAKVYEIEYSAINENSDGIQVSSNMTIVDNKALPFAMDGSLASYTTLQNADGGTKADDYVQVDLGSLEIVYDAAIYFGTNSFKETKLQISADGQTWRDLGNVPATSYSQSNGLSMASFTSNGGLARYLRFSTTQDHDTNAQIYEIKTNLTLDAASASPSVSSNMPVYQTNTISNALDRNMSTKFYSSRGSEENDYIQVDFGSDIVLYDTRIYFNGNPNVYGAVDGFAETQLQVSSDLSTWDNVGTPLSKEAYKIIDEKYVASFILDGISARYLRFVATQASDSWVQVFEIEYNNAMDDNTIRYADEVGEGVNELYPNEDYINHSTVTIAHSNLLDDGDIYTGPTITNVDANDVLIYPTNVITSVETLTMVQDATTISNAQVHVLTTEGTWIEKGIFDEPVKQFDVQDQILAVKLTFDGTVNPDIYEILFSEGEIQLEPADYSNVEAAIERANALIREHYVSFDAVDAAIAAVVYDKDISQQAEVDAMAQAIQNAIDALVTLPLPITTLSATALTYKSIQLTWDAQSVDGYKIYRQNTKTGEWIYLNTTTENTYVVNGVKTGLVYSYKVIPFKTIDGNIVEATDSNIATGQAMLQGTPNITIENIGLTQFKVSWEPLEGATRYIIYRKTADTEYKKIITLGKDATSYTSFSMVPNTYTYCVKAARYDGSERVMSEPSNEVHGISGCAQPVLQLTKTSDTSIQLSWEAIEGMKYYEIHRAQEDGNFRRWKVTSDTQIENKNLKPGTYTYKVLAYRVYNGTKLYSPESDSQSITLE